MEDHTAGAIRAAEIITGDQYSSADTRTCTMNGSKTTKGIADLIDRETAAPELLASLEATAKQLQEVWAALNTDADDGPPSWFVHETDTVLRTAKDAIAKATSTDPIPTN
jgi:hypothetical protein